MHAQPISGTPIPNRDMFLGEDVLHLFPKLIPILHNPKLEAFFAAQEAVAIKWKRRFVKWGSLCLIIVCLLLILLSWRLSLAELSIQFPPVVGYLAAGLGIIAVAIQIYLALSRTHSKWLYARYAAECTRLWKYQSFLNGNLMSLLDGPAAAFDAELADRWTLFSAQFKGGAGGMSEFIESSPFELFVTPSHYNSQAVFEEARKAYQLLRLDVQKAHLAYKNNALEAVDLWTDSVARISLLVSGLIAIVDACLVVASAIGWLSLEQTAWGILAAILAGSALSLAVVSAGVRVYRSASAITEERERYRFKQLHLRRIDDQMKQLSDPRQILPLMERVEIVCTEELQEFLRSLSHADYFL